MVEANGQTENAIKHRINAGDKASNTNDEKVASIFNSKFCIPLDFEIPESSGTFSLSVWFRKHSRYESTFADYSDA